MSKHQAIKKRMAIVEEKNKEAERDKESQRRWAVVSDLLKNGVKSGEHPAIVSIKLRNALARFTNYNQGLEDEEDYQMPPEEYEEFKKEFDRYYGS